MIIAVCVCAVVGLFFNWLFARMLYYGWKEQEEHQSTTNNYTIVAPQGQYYQ